METWMKEYEKQFRKAMKSHRREYWALKDLDDVPSHMPSIAEDFRTNTFRLEGRAMQATCKALKIKFEREAILSFIKSHK